MFTLLVHGICFVLDSDTPRRTSLPTTLLRQGEAVSQKGWKWEEVRVHIESTRHTSVTLFGFLRVSFVVNRKYCEQMTKRYVERIQDGFASGASSRVFNA